MQANEISDLAGPDRSRTIEIEVNKKRVDIHQREVTGNEIKAAAIQQGVSIEQDFLLYIVLEGGHLDRVQDDEKVTVREGERFRAITPDDVSEV
jgi:Multiubiquitin